MLSIKAVGWLGYRWRLLTALGEVLEFWGGILDVRTRFRGLDRGTYLWGSDLDNGFGQLRYHIN